MFYSSKIHNFSALKRVRLGLLSVALLQLSACSDTGESPGPQIELDGQLHLSNLSGNSRLYGTVRNPENRIAIFVHIRCNFYNAASELVDWDRTFVYGSNIYLEPNAIHNGITTNTALHPNETGVFEIWKNNDEAFSTFDCEFTSDSASGKTSSLKAQLEISGEPTITENADTNYISYSGEVKNTGSTKLARGRAYFVTRGTADSIIHISSSDIDGETVIDEFGWESDTGLDAGATTTFSVETLYVPLSSYGSHSIVYSWEDYRESNKVLDAEGLALDDSTSRTSRIDLQRLTYLSD